MTKFIIIFFMTILYSSCGSTQNNQQPASRLVGGCEGCEAIFEYGNKKLGPVDTLPDFNQEGMKIKVTGTIYHQNGTPAKDVILYVYHTDQQGVYPIKGGEKGWAQRHGYIRGWVKTDEKGSYTFYTLRPGLYPERNSPAHIHPTILEPSGKYYWLEDYLFEGDPLLTQKDISPQVPRGGSMGVLTLKKEGNIWIGKRDFILGKNIPGYK
jgi:protocatechuate 3,4-dioxygenase beta subunit